MIQEKRTRQERHESRQISGGNNKCPFLKAEVTNFVTGITRIVEVETQEEIVATASKSNLQQLTQTAGTAFCPPPLKGTFGPCVNNGANCNDVITGFFIPPEGLDPFSVSLLQTLGQPTSLSDKGVIDFSITPATHSQAQVSQKDKTAVEPSALSNNSHYICSIFDPTLNEVDCTMRCVPLEFAFTPPHWCYITDVEIFKQAGRINIKDMRLIQLINNKLVWKKVIANSEICKEVAEEQHGSRKHNQTGNLVLNKVLVGDLF